MRPFRAYWVTTHELHEGRIFTARCFAEYARSMPWQDVSLSVCLSARLSVCLLHAGIMSKRLNMFSNFIHLYSPKNGRS